MGITRAMMVQAVLLAQRELKKYTYHKTEQFMGWLFSPGLHQNVIS